jgi:hypothetical protein
MSYSRVDNSRRNIPRRESRGMHDSGERSDINNQGLRDLNLIDHGMSVKSRMMERGGGFNIDTTKDRPTQRMEYDNPYDDPYDEYDDYEAYTGPIGEITGGKYDVNNVDMGMPMRSSFRESTGPSDAEHDYTTDFFLHDKTSNLDVSYHDPVGTSDNFSMAKLNEFSSTILSQPESSPITSICRSNNELACVINKYLHDHLDGDTGVSNIMVTIELFCLYLLSHGKTKLEIKHLLSLPDQKTTSKIYFNLCEIINNIPYIRACNILCVPNGTKINLELCEPIISAVNLLHRYDERDPSNLIKINRLTHENTGFSKLYKSPNAFKKSLSILSTTRIVSAWARPFSKNNTAETYFYGNQTKKRVKMMKMQNVKQMYYEDHYSKILELPLLSKDYVFGFIIGKHDNKTRIEHNILESYINKLTPQDLDLVSIPKFTSVSQYKLNKLLKTLNFTSLFSDIDISHLIMSDYKHYIDTFLVNTIVVVDEGGENNGDKISPIRGSRSLPSFNANRPFFWYLRYIPDNLILVNGHYE